MRTDRVFLGLGSNLDARAENLASAIDALDARGGFTRLACSRLYRTEALGDPGGPPFLNAAVAGLWDGTPMELLFAGLEIEARLGRTRSYRNAPRTLDIDILFWERLEISTPRLAVPHPRLTGRAFALLPLLELAPDLVDPQSRRPLSAFVTSALLTQGICVDALETDCV